MFSLDSRTFFMVGCLADSTGEASIRACRVFNDRVNFFGSAIPTTFRLPDGIDVIDDAAYLKDNDILTSMYCVEQIFETKDFIPIGLFTSLSDTIYFARAYAAKHAASITRFIQIYRLSQAAARRVLRRKHTRSTRPGGYPRHPPSRPTLVPCPLRPSISFFRDLEIGVTQRAWFGPIVLEAAIYAVSVNVVRLPENKIAVTPEIMARRLGSDGPSLVPIPQEIVLQLGENISFSSRLIVDSDVEEALTVCYRRMLIAQAPSLHDEARSLRNNLDSRLSSALNYHISSSLDSMISAARFKIEEEFNVEFTDISRHLDVRVALERFPFIAFVELVDEIWIPRIMRFLSVTSEGRFKFKQYLCSTPIVCIEHGEIELLVKSFSLDMLLELRHVGSSKLRIVRPLANIEETDAALAYMALLPSAYVRLNKAIAKVEERLSRRIDAEATILLITQSRALLSRLRGRARGSGKNFSARAINYLNRRLRVRLRKGYFC